MKHSTMLVFALAISNPFCWVLVILAITLLAAVVVLALTVLALGVMGMVGWLVVKHVRQELSHTFSNNHWRPVHVEADTTPAVIIPVVLESPVIPDSWPTQEAWPLGELTRDELRSLYLARHSRKAKTRWTKKELVQFLTPPVAEVS